MIVAAVRGPLTLPNLITFLRLLAVPVTIWLILVGQLDIAFWVFAAAGVSDGIDGFIARTFNAQSELGRYLDPIADKALLVSVFIALGWMGDLPLWLVILVVSRDLMIVGGLALFRMLGIKAEIQPLLSSKLNTFAQILLAGLVMANIGLGLGLESHVSVLIYAVGLVTLISGYAYVAQGVRHLSAYGQPK